MYRIPEDDIRSMVYQLALRDDTLKNRILSQYRETISARQLQQLKETIRNIRYAYGDRHGFVDWRNASGYISALDGFLYDNVQPLIDRNLLEPAFALTCEVFMTIVNTDIDDDGDVAIGAQTCLAFWGKIADTCSGIRKDLLAAEKMLPELMEEVARDSSTYTLDRYEKILRPRYADQIRDMYADLIRRGSDRASDRRGYYHQVQELKKLTRYEGGREIARNIAAEWRTMYARRPAFMDELRKAGF